MVADAVNKIAELNELKAKLQNIPPHEQMTEEVYQFYFPERKVDYEGIMGPDTYGVELDKRLAHGGGH